jgi:hypothetical protein
MCYDVESLVILSVINNIIIMKPKLIIAIYAALFALSANSYAQQAGLVQDQNPGYESSRAKYMNIADSLTTTEGSTVQQTYKAYDWYQAREERRKLRREQSSQNSWYYPSAYYTPGYSTWGYNNWNYGNWGHRGWRHNNLWLGW